MDTAKLVTQWLFMFGLGLSCASLYLRSNLTISPASLCVSFHSSLPAIWSVCVEYLYHTWSLLSRQQDHSQVPLLTPRSLFLLVNLIIFFILISLHLRQHAATGKRRRRRGPHTETFINDQEVLLQGSSLAGLAGDGAIPSAAMAPCPASPGSAFAAGSGLASPKASVKNFDQAQSSVRLQQVEGSEESSDDQQFSGLSAVTEARGSMESLINEAISKEESLSYDCAELPASMEVIAADDTESTSDRTTSGSSVVRQGSRSLDWDGINGPDVEKIVLEEDGRLRLIEGHTPSSRTASHKSMSNSEDRESTNGSDAEKIILEEDGRLRLIDRPEPYSRCRPEKSHSAPESGDYYENKENYDGDNNNRGINYYSDNSRDINYDNKSNLRGLINYGDNYIPSQNHSLIKDDDLSQDQSHNHSLIKDDDLSHDHAHNHSLIKDDDLSQDRQQEEEEAAAHDKSSSVVGNVSRTRKKKPDSMDATWRAINDSKAGNASRDPRRMITRQNSRHGFKARARPPVRREPSISQEELNVKVESFIERFNEQIRLQRQQSLLSSYMQMVDRGA